MSLIQVLESLSRQSYYTEKLVFDQESKPGQYGSFQDGQYYKENTLLGVQERSFSIGLYIDDFEICKVSLYSALNTTGPSWKECCCETVWV